MDPTSDTTKWGAIHGVYINMPREKTNAKQGHGKRDNSFNIS
jgi:hypothetical protein